MKGRTSFAALCLIVACTSTPSITTTSITTTTDAPTTAAPTTTPPLLIWSPERVTEDWPGALRVEPSGSVDVQTIGNGSDHFDPRSDVAIPMVDVIEVTLIAACWRAAHCVFFKVASEPVPIPDPRVDWVGYGIVVDSTGDGLPDVRLGVDNATGIDNPGADWHELRMWRTDLATGTTEVTTETLENLSIMDADFPGRLDEAGHIWARRLPDEVVFHFYVWASIISDGQVVVSDYAPDAGWLTLSS